MGEVILLENGGMYTMSVLFSQWSAFFLQHQKRTVDTLQAEIKECILT